MKKYVSWSRFFPYFSKRLVCVLLLLRNFSPVQKVFTLQTHSEKYIKCLTLQLPPPSSKNITNPFFLVQQLWFSLDYNWTGIRRYVSTCVTLGTSFIPSVSPSASQRECSLKTVKVYKHSLTITSKRGKVFCLGQNYLLRGATSWKWNWICRSLSTFDSFFLQFSSFLRGYNLSHSKRRLPTPFPFPTPSPSYF